MRNTDVERNRTVPQGRGQRVRLWEAVVLAIVVGGLSYAAGMRNGIRTERRRAERSLSAHGPHEPVADSPAESKEAPSPPMSKEEVKARLAGFGFEELLSIGQQHLQEAQVSSQGSGSEGAGRRFMIAAAAYERALELRPGDPNVLMDLGLALQGLGEEDAARARLKEAASGYERALQQKPNDPNVLTDLGVVERALGDPEGAVKRFRLAAQADAKHAQSRFNLGLVLLTDLGRTDEAIAAWEDYLRVAPKDDELRAMVEEKLAALKR